MISLRGIIIEIRQTMSLPQRLQFSKKQLTDLGKAVCEQYSAAYNRKNLENTDLSPTDMFKLILQKKQKQLSTQDKEWQIQCKQLQNQSYIVHNNHYQHMSEVEADRIVYDRKNQKIFSRLIALKNEKAQQLAHFRLKYDTLIGENKRLHNVIQVLGKERDMLVKECKDHVVNCAKMQDRYGRCKLLLDETKVKFQVLRGELDGVKSVFKLLLNDVSQEFNKTQQTVSDVFQGMIKKFADNIGALRSEIIKQINLKETMQVIHTRQIESRNKTIHELVLDLAKLTNLKKSDDTNIENWLSQYRNYKLLNKKLQDNRGARTYPRQPRNPRQQSIREFRRNCEENLRELGL